MKTRLYVYQHAILAMLFLFSFSTKMEAFNYSIKFTGSNASTSVASVEVQNLTKGTTVTVPAGNTLNLYDVVSSIDQPSINDDAIHIYPNPMQGKAMVSFYAKQAGNNQINVFGVDGRNLTSINSNLQEGNNTFQLSLAPGAYILKVNGNGYTYAQRVISQSNSTDKPTISFIGNEKPTNSQPQKTKHFPTVTSMLYSVGDQLLYKGTSGNYTTIVTDKPTESKTTNFYFVECKDADDNYYPVVIIGSQIWMAENLKTTSYRTGEGVSNVTDGTSWAAAGFGAWCDYENLEANGLKYGKLYNWFAASDSRNISPIGWHVPTDAEWTAFTTYLGGETVAGGKLKQTSTTNWTTPNNSATNETGFSALPGGFRYDYGLFIDQSNNENWWSSTEYNTSNALARNVHSYDRNVFKSNYKKQHGFSIRCLSDIIIVVPPTLNTTTAATSITGFTASSGGNVTLQGGAAVTARGVCWSTSPGPTIALNTKTSDGTGIGTFTSAITGLTPNTTYYVRAYATNSGGTSYGTEVSFQTATTPTLTTTVASNVASTSATSGGNISSDGRATVTARGVCWSTSPNPTIYDNRTSNGTGSGLFTSSLTVLFSSTTYYVRAYATNSAGTGYGNEQTFNTTMAQDIDGNQYSSVKIGTQTWMGENLKTTRYRNNESISKPTTATNWSNATYGAWCDYNSDAANGTKYGHLYNWYAIADARNIAPVGWHVSTDNEWAILADYLGGEFVAGGKLKEAGNVNWALPNTGATNETSFTALPGGYRGNDGIYNSLGYDCDFWTTSEGDATYAWYRGVVFGNNDVDRGSYSKVGGFSVRCIRDEAPTLTTTAVKNISANATTGGGDIASDGGSAITARGVCWSKSPAPTIADSKTFNGSGIGVFTSSIAGLSGLTTYFARAYATNAVGTSYGAEVSFTTLVGITDIDGNVYTSITIGTQTWMVENLKTTKYRNGDAIPSPAGDWSALTSGAQAAYNNDAANATKYGLLYNWYAIADTRKIAPVGWHVASDAEWTTLGNYVANNLGTSLSVAKALSATTDWISYSTVGTIGSNLTINNSAGFSALPGGYRGNGGTFSLVGSYGDWWSSPAGGTSSAWARGMNYYDSGVSRYDYYKQYGFSVRCLRDNAPTLNTTAVSAISGTTATSGGNVTDDGGAAITVRGVCWSTTTLPTAELSTKTIETGTIGAFTTSMTGLTPNTTYYVRAYAINSAGTAYGAEVSFTTQAATVGITDIDGNVYTSVTIGTQTWMVENLKTTHYRNGDVIPSPAGDWTALTTGAQAAYNNDAANVTKYGLLYNWYAASDSRNIAPTGWHVPTQTEWNTLNTYLGGESIAGGKLKEAGTANWNIPNTDANNSSNFTALPGGLRSNDATYNGLGSSGYWWSRDAFFNRAWLMYLNYNNNSSGIANDDKMTGFSVRCVRD